MENLYLIKIEIFVFLFTFLYTIYYLVDCFYKKIKKIKNKALQKDIKQVKSSLNTLNINKENNPIKKQDNNRKIEISGKELNYLNELLKRVKNNASKGYFDTAKGLIVEGLSIDKHNKELNLELANIYSKEGKFKNAELIYKDLIEYYKNDSSILKKLGFSLYYQEKLDEAFDVFNKIHNRKLADDEVVDYLSEISFSLEKYKEALKFVNLYLRSKPRDTDKLFLKAFCYEYFRDYNDAISVYKRILELQPYNAKAKERINEVEKFII